MTGGVLGGIAGGAIGTMIGGPFGALAGGVAGGVVGGYLGSKMGGTKKPTVGPMGSFNVEQTNNDGANSSSGYNSDIKVGFSPDEKLVNSSEIAFVQNVRVVDADTKESVDPRDNFQNRKTDDEYTIDRLDNRKYGWYGYNNDGLASATISPGSAPTPKKDAILTDRPQWSRPNTSFDFETAAIDKSGEQGNKVYGSVTWGFSVDKENKLSSHPVEETLTPSSEFNEAVEAWNEQAEGPEDKRNHPDQEKLGPFT